MMAKALSQTAQVVETATHAGHLDAAREPIDGRQHIACIEPERTNDRPNRPTDRPTEGASCPFLSAPTSTFPATPARR